MTDTTAPTYALRFPQCEGGGVAQDAECAEIELDGSWRTLRFHDYADIFSRPGLYEQLFHEVLECCSPEVVVDALAREAGGLEGRRVLDVGAGNGMVGERLRAAGAETVVGVDLIEEAAEAAERDRPGVYDDYLVADLTALTGEQDATLRSHRFDVMTTVAALGFGDIPVEAFAVAFNHVADGGLVGMNIKEDFLEEGDFAGFIRRMDEAGAMHVRTRERYRHRLSVTGEELHYVAVIAEKCRDIAVRTAGR